MHCDILIIGAGAAGLMAMNKLVQAGYKVCLLEAAETAGGRIATDTTIFNEPVETGAEFIHGKAPVTIELLKQASLSYTPVEGKMITVRDGVWFNEDDDENGFDPIIEKLNGLKEDRSIRNFLDENFPEKEYDELRTAVTHLAEGFDLADINKASVLALRKEWAQLEEEQCRIPGGYKQLINHLLKGCSQNGSVIHYSSPVHTVEQHDGHIVAHTKEKQFTADKIIVTVSAGVLQSGAITFVPALKEHSSAIQQLGFGSVIKILFRFKDAFWLNEHADIGFLLSDEAIPTWWTQLPNSPPLLTGWLGGPKAAQLSKTGTTNIFEKAISSLSNIFHIDIDFLRSQLSGHKIVCWDNNPNTKGGYSYNTLQSDTAKRILQQPVNNSIYFAGEAIHTGESQATVEAALASGQFVAEKIMTQIK
jgi:monoamine oxidase